MSALKIFLTAGKCSNVLETYCKNLGFIDLHIFLYTFFPSSAEFAEGNKSHFLYKQTLYSWQFYMSKDKIRPVLETQGRFVDIYQLPNSHVV